MNTNTASQISNSVFFAMRHAAQEMLIKSSVDKGVTLKPESLGTALAIASNSLYMPRKGNMQTRIAVTGGWEFRLSSKGWVDHNNNAVPESIANGLNWAMTFFENKERNNVSYVVCVNNWNAVANSFHKTFEYLLNMVQ